MTKKNIPAADSQPAGHVQVASVTGTSPEDVQRLLAQIADLQEKLGIEQAARSDAEKAALAAAESQGMLMQRDIQEVATGKFVKVKRAIDENGNPAYEVKGYKEDGREILKPVFRLVDLPTYFYKIDLPPVGGTGLVTNGVDLYHGTVYELDLDTLRSVKERVHRLWDHDRNVHGSNENFYRKPQNTMLSARG